MNGKPSPRMDALRAMREKQFEEAAQAARMSKQELETALREAARRSDHALERKAVRKKKKAKRNSR